MGPWEATSSTLSAGHRLLVRSRAAGEGAWTGLAQQAVHAAAGPSSGLKVMLLGLVGADPQQLRRLVAGTEPAQTFSAEDDGPSLDRAVSGLATSLCQVAVATQVWRGLQGLGEEKRRVGALSRPAWLQGSPVSTARALLRALSKGKRPGLRGWAMPTPGPSRSDPP